MNTEHLTARRAVICSRLRNHLDEIDDFVQGVEAPLLRERPDPARWSIHEHLMHLAETQDVFMERIAHMLTEERPRVEPFVPDEARTRGAYLGRNIEEGLRMLHRQREHLLALLSSLDDAQWKREGQHPEMRHYTVELCAEALMRHEEHHLYAIFELYFGTRE
jgi:hypothetical protein